MHACPGCGTNLAAGSQFCARCGRSLQAAPLPPTQGVEIVRTAAMPSWPAAPIQPSMMGTSPTPSRTRGGWLLFAGVFIAGALTAAGGAALYVRDRPRAGSQATPPRPATTAVPSVAPDAILEQRRSRQPAPTPTPTPTEAPPVTRPVTYPLSIVHYHTAVDSPAASTGAPDGHFATIRSGTLTLQLSDGQQLISDGTSAPDVRVVVDPSLPGPFRIEIGVGHNVFIVVEAAAQGSVDVDIDGAGVRIGRFVRLSTRSLRSEVGVDAVLVRTPTQSP